MPTGAAAKPCVRTQQTLPRGDSGPDNTVSPKRQPQRGVYSRTPLTSVSAQHVPSRRAGPGAGAGLPAATVPGSRSPRAASAPPTWRKQGPGQWATFRKPFTRAWKRAAAVYAHLRDHGRRRAGRARCSVTRAERSPAVCFVGHTRREESSGGASEEWAPSPRPGSQGHPTAPPQTPQMWGHPPASPWAPHLQEGRSRGYLVNCQC